MTSSRLPDLTKSGGFIGMAGMATVLFLDLATSGITPLWATALLVVLWLVLFVLACRWFVARPVRVFVLPLVAFAVWLATVLVGTNRYGWGS